MARFGKTCWLGLLLAATACNDRALPHRADAGGGGGNDPDGGGRPPDAGGSDAALPDPGACRLGPTTPLGSFTVRDVDVHEAATTSVAVPDGFLVTGRVSLPALPAGFRFYYGSMELFDATARRRHVASIKPTGDRAFDYRVVLAAGEVSWRAKIVLAKSEGGDKTGDLWLLSRTARGSFAVCGDASHAVPLPAFGDLEEVAVTVDGMDAVPLPPDIETFDPKVFFVGDGEALVSEHQRRGVTGDHVAFRVWLPPVPMTAYAWKLSEVIRLPDQPPAPALAYTLPPLAVVHATLTPPAAVVSVVSICTPRDLWDDPFLPVVAESARGLLRKSSGGVFSDMAVRAGAGCVVRGEFDLAAAPAAGVKSGGRLFVPVASVDAIEVIDADQKRAFDAPKASTVEERVEVRDARGKPLAGLGVAFDSTELAPPLGDVGFHAAAAKTDAAGAATLRVPPGRHVIAVVAP